MDSDHPLDARIRQANARFKAARLGLAIERRGETLGLRGTLPPRPGSARLRPHQQRLPLKRPANKVGLKQIEQDAKGIAGRLVEGRFDWADYLYPQAGPGGNLADQIERFRLHFFSQYGANPVEQAAATTTWQKSYAPHYQRLQAVAARSPHLSAGERVLATVQQTRAHSRSRQICCTALAALAEFLQWSLPFNLKDYWGSYGSSKTKPRRLPSDEDIVQWYARIPNPGWRYVYGLLATYGLRNHEAFFCDLTQLEGGQPNARVTVGETTKTGLHDVWPFYPEWVDQFELRQPVLPPIQTDLRQTTLQRVGQLVSNQFRRYEVPFSPYALRHAWAVRTIHFGLPDTVAARMMGHSVAIHTRTYHRWISLRDQQQAVDTALAQQRPQPPAP